MGYEEMIAVAFDGKELGDDRLSQVIGGRSMSGYIEYTVQQGDTFIRIAQRFHVTERDILDLNGAQPANHLFVGQILKVPVHIRGSR